MKRIAAASLLVTGLLACRSDQLLPPGGPSGLIRDAGHNGGNFFFAFLQPMVSRPTLNGVFDPTQSPTVKVELLTGGVDCTDPNLTYTTTTGPLSNASETVRVSDSHYIVNLHTDKVPVISGCTYRIRVLIGSIELGFADIALLLNQREAKNLTDNETVALVDGRTLPIKFWIAQGVLRDFGQGTASPNQQTIIVTQNMKAGVLIPVGAVLQPTTITIESVDDRPCFPGILARSFQGSRGATDNSCYRFTADPPLPDGKFEKNVIVGICVDLSLVGEDEEKKLQILQFDDGAVPQIKALPNVSAPFLPCDPAFLPPIGFTAPGLLDRAAQWFASLISPRPLFASATNLVFDLGAGGSAEGFSLFTWGFVTNMEVNAGDEQSAVVGTAVETAPSVIFTDSTGAPVDGVPVTFSVSAGGGTITGAVTTSGLGGIPGVAQVGSWTLGSAGTNTLIASAPAFSAVTPTSVTFTATGLAALLSPASGLAIAQNNSDIGCELLSGQEGRGYGFRIFFDWIDVAGASRYDIRAIREGAELPLVESTTTSSELQITRCNSFVEDGNLEGWDWTVTAFDEAGANLWTATGSFMFAPCRRDGGFPCRVGPAGELDQQQSILDTDVGGSTIDNLENSEQKLAQVVSVGTTGDLIAIAVPVSCESGSLIVQVQGVTTDEGGESTPNGTVLASKTIGTSLLSGPFAFREIVFDAPVSFDVEEKFAIVLSNATGFCAIAQGPIGDSYGGGHAYYDARPNPPGWVRLGDRDDLPFMTFMR